MRKKLENARLAQTPFGTPPPPFPRQLVDFVIRLDGCFTLDPQARGQTQGHVVGDSQRAGLFETGHTGSTARSRGRARRRGSGRLLVLCCGCQGNWLVFDPFNPNLDEGKCYHFATLKTVSAGVTGSILGLQARSQASLVPKIFLDTVSLLVRPLRWRVSACIVWSAFTCQNWPSTPQALH